VEQAHLRRGGLSLHAGCKVVSDRSRRSALLIIGLSGTGKTTTTFTRQNDSKPVQDDFVALYPGGRIVATENGCFAKTFALDPQFEPSIYGAVVSLRHTRERLAERRRCHRLLRHRVHANGRAVFRMDALGCTRCTRGGVGRSLPDPQSQRQSHPGVARLNREQAALYFMLARRAAPRRAARRRPASSYVFPAPTHSSRSVTRAGEPIPRADGQQSFQVYLLNTGRVGHRRR